MFSFLSSKTRVIIQICGLLAFSFMGLASASSQQATRDSGIDFRGAAAGAYAGYQGYIIIGSASSQSEAYKLAEKKGYSKYLWDSVNGNVYAK